MKIEDLLAKAYAARDDVTWNLTPERVRSLFIELRMALASVEEERKKLQRALNDQASGLDVGCG